MIDDGRCQGVICWDLLNGGLKTFGGKTVILATGGAGPPLPRDDERLRVHRRRHGDGACAPALPLKDMEFMQFHPTTLYPTGILITEGCRGEGAFLINKDGERFMKRYAPNALELASRDVVSRSEQTEIDEGRGINGSVMLDLRHLGAERIIERLPGSRELAMTFAGVDPIYEPIPVRPGAHYHMGGVETDTDGLTELTGLYAAGEAACVSVHGANRLGGNSLMETITFGRRAGTRAAEWALSHTTIEVPESLERDAERELKDAARPRRPASARGRSATSSARRCSRTSASSGGRRRWSASSGSSRAARALRANVVVEDKGDVFNSDLTQAIELGYLLDLAGLHAAGRRRAQGEPRRPLAPARLPDARRRELPQALDHALGRRPPRALVQGRAHDEVGARWRGRTRCRSA